MQRLSRIVQQPSSTEGRVLPLVFSPLEQAGIRPRLGTVCMIAAVPGAMKSMLALYWTARMNLPTLFFSADTDAYESTKRAAAMVSGDTQDVVEHNLNNGDTDRYFNVLDTLNLRWVFETDPTYLDLELETAAFAEVHGEFPKVIVIDNLMNVVGDNENEFASMRDTTKALKRLVRITDAAVFVLHHMQETEKDTSKPPARNRLQGKVSQLPEIILSIARNGDEMRISPVKNRFGPGDASGETYVSLWTDATRCRFYASQWHKEQGVPV